VFVATQCSEAITYEIHFILSGLAGENFMVKTLNHNRSVIPIQVSMLKTQNQTRMKMITMMKNNHLHQCMFRHSEYINI